MLFVISGCKSAENVAENNSSTTENSDMQGEVNTVQDSQEESNSEAIVVNYRNQSSNIQIALDPSKDEFYMDLSGMSPQEKDSIVVQDSTLLNNRATDIQTLLSSYRKAQDLFYIEEYRQALEEVDKTLGIQETADAYALKGTIFFMMENLTAARANWNKAVQMDPNIPVPSIPELETLIDEIRGEGN
ncbi:MAG: hypothetical protein BalsKO_24570 [Balneolaceae bacterium]